MDKKNIRIQKVLSDNGILSRRKTEEYIKQNRITVNGRPATIGHAVNIKRDIIAIDGQRVHFARRKENIYLMLHKPRGYVTTLSDELGRKTVADLLTDITDRVYPVGRLDKDSEGLLLLTNDGAFANQVMHPSSHIGKTYRVTLQSDITDAQLVTLSTGVELEDGKTAPAQVHVITQQPGRTVLQITIFEGKNRQIRRMCEAVGLTVARLKRTAVGPLKLGMLSPGEYRPLRPVELTAIRNAASKGAPQPQNEEKPKPKAQRPPARKATDAKKGPKPIKR